MAFLPVSVPDSAKRLLNQIGVQAFSKTQTLSALLYWYANLPLAYQLHLARDYANQLPGGKADAMQGKLT
jgi:hypothetical protein